LARSGRFPLSLSAMAALIHLSEAFVSDNRGTDRRRRPRLSQPKRVGSVIVPKIGNPQVIRMLGHFVCRFDRTGELDRAIFAVPLRAPWAGKVHLDGDRTQ
jgi:hypothetical protein